MTKSSAGESDVKLTITVAGHASNEAAVQRVVGALRAALKLSTTETVDATIVVQLTEHVGPNTEGPSPGTDRVRQAKDHYPRAYQSWEASEDQRLRDLHEEGRSIDEISRILQRQPGAIRSRLDKLQLIQQPHRGSGGEG